MRAGGWKIRQIQHCGSLRVRRRLSQRLNGRRAKAMPYGMRDMIVTPSASSSHLRYQTNKMQLTDKDCQCMSLTLHLAAPSSETQEKRVLCGRAQPFLRAATAGEESADNAAPVAPARNCNSMPHTYIAITANSNGKRFKFTPS